MFLPRRLLPLAVALGAAVANAATPKLEGWYKCSEITFESYFPENADSSMLTGAECATFKAPLCYDGVCEDETNTEVDIFVKRIAGTGSDLPNVFFMQGGPGAASPAMEDAMQQISAILGGEVNVYTMDHRGTGRSTKLDCVAAQAQTSGSPSGTSVDSSEVASCAQELQNKYGKDLASFSVTSAASDLKYFISNFLKGEKTFVYGVSYGTSLVERLIHLDTKEIAGYILDGIATSSGSDVKNFEFFSTWDPDFSEVGEYFLAACADNEACGQYFKETSVSDSLKALVANLDDPKYKCYEPLDTILSNAYGYPAKTFPPSDTLRSLMGSLLASSFRRRFIPILTYRLTRCNTDDIKVVNHFMTQMTGGSGGIDEESFFSSDLVYKIIVYSEFWETPTPSTEEMYQRFLNTTMSSGSYSEVETYCVFSKEDSEACKDFAEFAKYDAGKILYKKDKYWNKAAKPPKDVSVLLMSSKMDPQTPHKYAEYLLEALDTENKKLVTFDQATHATLWTTPYQVDGPTCGMELVASYIANGGDLKATNYDCVDLMPAVSFSLPEEYVAEYLNATSPYEGAYTGTAGLPTVAPSTAPTAAEGNKDSSSTNTNTNTNANDSSSKTSYLGVFIAFAVAFAVAAVAAGVFIVKYRNAKKQSLDNANAYTASTV